MIQQISALPSGVDAPNMIITEHAIDQFRLASSISTQGWLIQTARPLTGGQINSAEQAAAAADDHRDPQQHPVH